MPRTDDARVLKLTKGYVAVVSKEDYRRVNRHKWHVHMSAGRGRRLGLPYARTVIDGKKVYLHRFVMEKEIEVRLRDGCTDNEAHWHVDHVNHQTLDCRRGNLAVLWRDENLKKKRNRKKEKRVERDNVIAFADVKRELEAVA